MRKFTFSFKSLLVAAGLLLGGANSAWADEWQDIKSWNLTALTSAELSGYAWLTNQNNEGKTFYINTAEGKPFSVTDTESALYGLKFEGNYSGGVKGGFNTTSSDAASRGFIFGGGAGKITIPNLKAGQKVVVTLKVNEAISSSELSDITISGAAAPYTSTGIVKADGDVVIVRSNATNYCQTITVQAPVVTETYDFNAARTSSNVDCTKNGDVSVNGTGSGILVNANIEMNDRFAAQGDDKWMIHKDNALYNANKGGRAFGILKLKAGDKVALTFTEAEQITFNGTPNVNESVDAGDKVVSGTFYTIKSDGMLALSVARNKQISSVVIKTVSPVLTKPTVSFNSMVENEGLYYPKYTFSSAEDGVKFYDGDGNDITSGYTFTSAGTQTVYAGKDGRTNSAKVSFSADKVGMILANSVSASSLTGNINYNTGSVIAYNNDIAGTWALPGINFESTSWTYYTSNVKPTSGNRTLSCSVLNENRVATFKHKYYSTGNTIYDYLTSSKNGYTFSRSGKNYDEFQQYNLYVMPSEQVSVTIGSTGYSTFSSPVPLNFAGVSGLTAYVATSVADGTVTLTSVETAPANTGLVLKGTAGQEYNIPVTNAAVAPASNLLVGCIVETPVAVDATSGFNNYVLVIEGGVAKFQSLVDNGATIPAGKAFLKNGAYGGGVKALGVIFAGETATGVEAPVAAEAVEDGIYYNLNGQQVTKDYKGIVIVNGTKFLNK